jgi:hypothetical protein
MLNTSSHIDEKTCCNKNTEVRELTSDNELNTTQLDSMNCILPLDLEQEKDEDHHGYDVLEDFDDNLVDISELYIQHMDCDLWLFSFMYTLLYMIY